MTMSGSTPTIAPELDTPLHVAVAVIERNGRILLSRRAAKAHQGGKWEFPGGKLEPGESVTEALARELEEELGITPTETVPLIQIPFTYPERAVFLDVWKVTAFHGEPAGCEGQAIVWTGLDRLDEYEFPAANLPILEALRLPDCIAITAEDSVYSDQFVATLEAMVVAGFWVHLRLPGMDRASYSLLVANLAADFPHLMARIVLTSTMDEVEASGAAGLHLDGQRLMAMDNIGKSWSRVSASCHSLAELKQAESLGLRYVFLSPVLPTLTHPGTRPLGWARFAQWVRQLSIPVYALGGVSPDLFEQARLHGGQGVAGIRGFAGVCRI